MTFRKIPTCPIGLKSCIHCENGKCNLLISVEIQRNTFDCSFFKTKEEYYHEQLKVYERLKEIERKKRLKALGFNIDD